MEAVLEKEGFTSEATMDGARLVLESQILAESHFQEMGHTEVSALPARRIEWLRRALGAVLFER